MQLWWLCNVFEVLEFLKIWMALNYIHGNHPLMLTCYQPFDFFSKVFLTFLSRYDSFIHIGYHRCEQWGNALCHGLLCCLIGAHGKGVCVWCKITEDGSGRPINCGSGAKIFVGCCGGQRIAFYFFTSFKQGKCPFSLINSSISNTR